jgi:NAD kinase
MPAQSVEYKIVVVTRKTRLEELIGRFGTRDQAKFYIEHSGSDFSDYELEHSNYVSSLAVLKETLTDLPLKHQIVDREFLPTYLFSKQDIVVVIGQDGLVVNTAKYLSGQPIVAINPDPRRWDGVLLPFAPGEGGRAVRDVLSARAKIRTVTMAQATLNNGQTLLAFNDLFIGVKSHVSARYKLEYKGKSERQSSSGLIVSTGAGSTGWLSSTFNMVQSLLNLSTPTHNDAKASVAPLHMDWEERRLIFVVREPFLSKASGIDITSGIIDQGEKLLIESRIPENGVIFSDGVESDTVEFNSGAIATIAVSPKSTHLVVMSRT